MSIQYEVNRITQNIASAYTACAEKGATIPEQQNSGNLAAAILSIPEGSGGEEEIPDDGKTRIFIHLEDGRTSPVLGCCPKGTVTIDWGDGTDPDTLTGTSVTAVKYTEAHEYAESGDRVITLTVDGTFGIGGTSTRSRLLVYSKSTSDLDYYYSQAVRKIILGDGITAIGNYAFNYSKIDSITISDSVITIANYSFGNCYSLANITIPDSVTAILSYAFNYCIGMRYYDFSGCTDVPSLAAVSAFQGIPDDCEIRVPSALYDEWIAATNWSSYADYIVAV